MLSVLLLVLVIVVFARAVVVARQGRLRPAIGLAVVGALLFAWWVHVTGTYEVRKLVAQCLMPVGLLWLGLLGLAIQVSRMRLRRGIVVLC